MVAKCLHWGTALLLLFAYIANGDVTNALRDPAAMRMEAWLGLAILVIFAARYLWMHKYNAGVSRLPDAAPKWEHLVSRAAHHSLYLCVAAIVATGLLIWAAQSYGSDWMVNDARDIHEFFTNTTLFVIGAHVIAAFWHKLVRRDGIWEAIGTPWWQPKAGWRLLRR